MFFRRLDDHLGFARILAARFFDVDMFARLQRKQGGGCVPEIRRRNEDGVERLILEKLPKIFDAFARRVLFFADLF
jgi:hypothetical protein